MKIRSAFALSMLAAIFASTTLSSAAFAQNSQQSKMTWCNQQASGKKGEERKTFMKTCLSKEAPANTRPMNQREKMSACNLEAGNKKGSERKTFMKTCLSNQKD
jgi:hypothetical protein